MCMVSGAFGSSWVENRLLISITDLLCACAWRDLENSVCKGLGVVGAWIGVEYNNLGEILHESVSPFQSAGGVP